MIFFISLFALIIGSFISCATYRLGKNESFIFTNSKCPKCFKNLQWISLIPLLSFIMQRGKCKNCDQKISLRYPLIEIFFTITFLVIYFIFPNIDQKFILLCAIATTLIAMSIVDIENYFIPKSLQFFLLFFAIILLFLENNPDQFLTQIIAAFVYCGFGAALYLFFYLTAKIEAIGIDDIKLLFTSGLILGMNKFLIFILLTGFLGIIFGSIWIKLKNDETFPFAPSLCLSLFISLILDKKFDIVKLISNFIF